jgi:hypothetical protein
LIMWASSRIKYFHFLRRNIWGKGGALENQARTRHVCKR